MSQSRSASDVLDRDFLEIRSRILDLAAALDRIDRASDRDRLTNDPRLAQCQTALQTLLRSDPNRAELVQLLFSDPYQDDWRQQLPIAPRIG
ncbi:hypothetical protein [Tautonia rosea]|uniref:hypothetical protein n=1 Tax=Tautonia rosea TaxID=2728037 RepID=UPI00147514BF|nr:hypothetical protein [Tautonia rosea]